MGNKFRFWMIDFLHQVEDILHVIIVTVSFFLAAIQKPADVYHAHDVDTLLPSVLAGMFRKKKIVYDAHEYTLGQSNRGISHSIFQAIERTCIKRCEHVFTVNFSIADSMARTYHIPIPTVLMNVPSTAPHLDIPSLYDGQPIDLLFHGNFQNHRGLDTLVTAMSLIKTPSRLILRGYGEMEISLRNQVAQLGLQERVIFAPIVPLGQVVQSSIGCHVGMVTYEKIPAFIYSLPNKLFEYMAAGLAIVANNLPEISLIVNKYQLGVVYEDDNDPSLLASVIERLISDRSMLEDCRRRAYHIYHDQYAWVNHKHVLVDAYSNLRHV